MWTDRQTGMMATVAFRNFAKASKNTKVWRTLQSQITVHMPINYTQLVAGILLLRMTLSYIFTLSVVCVAENDISVMRVFVFLP